MAWRAGRCRGSRTIWRTPRPLDRPGPLGELLGLELELRRKQGKASRSRRIPGPFPGRGRARRGRVPRQLGARRSDGHGAKSWTVLDRPPGASDSELLDVVKGLMAADALETWSDSSPSPADRAGCDTGLPANLAPASRGGRPPGESSGGSRAATNHESSGDGSAAETFQPSLVEGRWGDGRMYRRTGRRHRPDHRCPESPRAPMPSEPSPPDSPARGSDPGRLQVLGEIARGGMGVVLKGRDSDLGRDLAVKILLESHRDKPEMIRRFIEEAQIAGQLQHPGIVPIYELGAFRRPPSLFRDEAGQGAHTLAEILGNRKSPERRA